MEEHVEIHFQYDSPVLGEPVEEVLWAKVVSQAEGVYELVSIPFYGLSLATADHFLAKYDEQIKGLIYQNTIKSSGNSTVVVAIMQADFDQAAMITALEQLHCSVERLNDRYLGVAVSKTAFYGSVRDAFDRYEQTEAIEYAEARLSAKHQSDLRRHR